MRFYNILNESNRNSYLIQVGLNMLAISATAVQVKINLINKIKQLNWIVEKIINIPIILQAVVNLDRPEEAIRSAVFCGANQFHLFVLSLPGQVLLDHCSEFSNNMYAFTLCKNK